VNGVAGFIDSLPDVADADLTTELAFSFGSYGSPISAWKTPLLAEATELFGRVSVTDGVPETRNQLSKGTRQKVQERELPRQKRRQLRRNNLGRSVD
jgi:hypothetical protein